MKVEPHVYPGVTREQLSAIINGFEASGTIVARDVAGKDEVYRVAGNGVQCRAVYDQTINTLMVAIIDKPYYLTHEFIHQQLGAALQKAGWKP